MNRIGMKVTVEQSSSAESKWMQFYGNRGSLLNERITDIRPLPVPFDQIKARRQVCNAADVCDSTLQSWAMGSQAVGIHTCRSIVAACLGLGIVPPAGAKVPPPVGVESPATKPLRVVS